MDEKMNLTPKALKLTGNTFMKHHKFLSFGFSALLAASSFELSKFGFSHMGNQTTQTLGAFLGYGAIGLTGIGAGIFSFLNAAFTLNSGKKIYTSISEDVSVYLLTKAKEKEINEVLPFPQKTLTFDENKINNYTVEFFKTL